MVLLTWWTRVLLCLIEMGKLSDLDRVRALGFFQRLSRSVFFPSWTFNSPIWSFTYANTAIEYQESRDCRRERFSILLFRWTVNCFLDDSTQSTLCNLFWCILCSLSGYTHSCMDANMFVLYGYCRELFPLYFDVQYYMFN